MKTIYVFTKEQALFAFMIKLAWDVIPWIWEKENGRDAAIRYSFIKGKSVTNAIIYDLMDK